MSRCPRRRGVGNSARRWCPRWPGTAPRWLSASRRQERERQRSPRPAGAPGPEGHSGRGRGRAAVKVENQLSSPLLSGSLPRAPGPHRLPRRGLRGRVCEPKSVHTSNLRPKSFTGTHGLREAARRRRNPRPAGPTSSPRPAGPPWTTTPSTVGRWAARPARGSVCPAPGTRASARLQGPPRPAPPHRAAGYRLRPVRGGPEEVIELREHAELAEQRPGRGIKLRGDQQGPQHTAPTPPDQEHSRRRRRPPQPIRRRLDLGASGARVMTHFRPLSRRALGPAAPAAATSSVPTLRVCGVGALAMAPSRPHAVGSLLPSKPRSPRPGELGRC